MYIEGVNFACDHHTTELFTFFGCNYLATGSEYCVETLSGLNGSIGQGYEFAYQYGTDSDHRVDEISANGGTIFFISQDRIGRGVCFDGGQRFHTIFTSTLLGSMIDGESPNTKTELMGSYLDYLTQPIVSIDDPIDPQESFVVSNYPNPFSNSTTFSFSGKFNTHDEYQICIYNIKGELVTELIPSQDTAGKLKVVWEGKDNNSELVPGGIYLYTLKHNEKIVAIHRTLVLR